MNPLQILTKKPFNLDQSSIQWVLDTHASLSLDTKLRQLFALPLIGNSPDAAAHIAEFSPGAVVRMPGPNPMEALKATKIAIQNSRVPMLVAGDLEGGVNHPPVLKSMPNALSLAAANDPELTQRVIDELALDARRFGYNWSFGPVLDLNHAFRSAIVSTRSFGSDVETVIEQAKTYLHALQGHGIAAAIKHWPGDGFDDRDQHLVTTVNPLSLEEWRKCFGRIYASLIDAGAMSVMSAHIALPAWAKVCGVKDTREMLRPASVSKFLNQDLLRHELGFNGLIVSDSAEMGGLLSWNDSNNLAVEIVANGCDMLLFPVNAERDLRQLHAALASGVLTQQRVDEAVIRILAMKAALGLHRSQSELADSLDSDGKHSAGHRSANASVEAGSKAITLVKDRAEVLPINRQRHKRLVIMEQSGKPLMPGLPTPSIEPFIKSLRDHGFEVQRHAAHEPFDPQTADLLLYVFTQEAALTVSHIGIDWALLHGHFPSSMQRYWHVLPTVMISFGHPYFLYDAPDVPTYINAYTAIPSVQEAVVKRLIGDVHFTGHSPVDPYCGLGSFYQLNKTEKN